MKQPQTKHKRVEFYVDPERYNQLKKLLKDNGVTTMSLWFRNCVEETIDLLEKGDFHINFLRKTP